MGQNTAGVFAVSVIIQLTGFIATYVMARGIGFTEAGKALYGLTQTFMIFASSINSLGDLRIGSAYVYFLSRGRPAEQSTGTYFGLRLGMVSAASLTLWLLAPYVGIARSADLLETLGLFMVLPLLWSVSTVYTQLQVAQGHSLRGQMPLLLESAVRTGGLVVALMHGPTLLTLTIPYVLGAGVSAVYSVPAVWSRVGKIRWSEAVDMFTYAWPLIGSLFLLYVATNTTQLAIIGLFGPVELNIYSVSNAYRILLLALPAAVTMPLFPYLVSLHAKREYEAVRSATWRALRFTAMAIVPGVMAFAVYRADFINVPYNGTYVSQGALPLAILAVSTLPAAFAQVIGAALNAVGYQRLELYLTSLQVGVLFTTTGLLLYPFQLFSLQPLYAAALTVLLSSLAAFALNSYFMERILAVRIQYRSIVFIIVSAAVSFVAISRLNRYIQPNHWYTLGAAVAIGFAVYFLVLALVGELTKDDVRQLIGFVGLPRVLGERLAIFCWRERPPEVNQARPGDGEGLRDPLAPAPPSR